MRTSPSRHHWTNFGNNVGHSFVVSVFLAVSVVAAEWTIAATFPDSGDAAPASRAQDAALVSASPSVSAPATGPALAARLRAHVSALAPGLDSALQSALASAPAPGAASGPAPSSASAGTDAGSASGSAHRDEASVEPAAGELDAGELAAGALAAGATAAGESAQRTARPVRAARYIAATLRAAGYAVHRQSGAPNAGTIEASLSNLAPGARPDRVFVVGARYADGGVVAGDPSGVAAVLELARLLKAMHPSRGTEIRFAFIDGPDRLDGGSFIAFAGTAAAARRVQQALAAFRSTADGPARGLAVPAFAQGDTLCTVCGKSGGHDGGPAVLVTGTTFMRYPYRDTGAIPDDASTAADDADAASAPYDYAGIARVLTGLAHTIEALGSARQG